jgi:hypothetical protein
MGWTAVMGGSRSIYLGQNKLINLSIEHLFKGYQLMDYLRGITDKHFFLLFNFVKSLCTKKKNKLASAFRQN